MNKYVIGMIVGIAIGVIGLGLLIYQTLNTSSDVTSNVSLIPPIGVLYGLIFAIGVISAIALSGLNAHEKTVTKK